MANYLTNFISENLMYSMIYILALTWVFELVKKLLK